MLPLTCQSCEYELTGQRTTCCSDCGAEYHQRCWDALGECKSCGEKEGRKRDYLDTVDDHDEW
jgi:hypothetical protein